MNLFCKFPLLITTLRDDLVILLASSEDFENDYDIIVQQASRLLYQKWAKNIITLYYKAYLHLKPNQTEIATELLMFVKPYVKFKLKKEKHV